MSDPGFFVHESSFVDPPAEIGEGTQIWHFTHVREGARIGPNCNIGQGCYVGRDVRIGSRCKLQNNVSVYEAVTLEDEVFCGPSCVFTNVHNPRAAVDRKAEFRPTLVRRGATIGANATILCGVTVGRWALIGAGAFIRENVPDFAIMVGVPARRIGWAGILGETLPSMLVGEEYTCPQEGHVYRRESVSRLRLLSPEPPVAP